MKLIRPTLLLSFVFSAALMASPQEEILDKAPKALSIINNWQWKDPVRRSKIVHIVYWTPSDREPIQHYDSRLGAIFDDIQRFYAKEMERVGFGPRTFGLDRDPNGKVKIHLARGARPYAVHSGKTGSEIRDECVPVLKAAGIDAENETFVIFCNMSNWDGEARVITQNSPYYASGTNCKGTAWQVDSEILDLGHLSHKEPRVKDGQYGDISIGKYNSIFIGGAAHELGHALGLPHNCESKEEFDAFGYALMGAGNRSYGDQLRGEGKGSFLTLAHALKLASHPLFTGSIKGIETEANAKPEDVKIVNSGKSFTYSAKVVSDPPAYAVTGYMDPDGGGDYNATTCTAVPDADGNFTLNAKELVAGKSGVFRVVIYQANGSATSFASPTNKFNYPYKVAADGTVDLSVTEAALVLAPLLDIVKTGTPAEVGTFFQKIKAAKPSAKVMESALVLAKSVSPVTAASPAEESANICQLSEARTLSSKIGYGRFRMNRPVPEMDLFTVGGELFSRGINAHAPSSFRWALDEKWKQLSGKAGLPAGDGRASCVFVIRADGRELWRSPVSKAGTLRDFKVAVDGVKELELVVEDAGDGNSADWGCWLEPVLTR